MSASRKKNKDFWCVRSPLKEMVGHTFFMDRFLTEEAMLSSEIFFSRY